ncbi:MAG TPA: DUF2059 domain-containing protein [Thermoanaerobaculia bacterium]|nr:DUF2059 domain-containing protein [Thermoanaerobaculia bacterium]
MRKIAAVLLLLVALSAFADDAKKKTLAGEVIDAALFDSLAPGTRELWMEMLTKQFDENELAQLRAFYASPLGQKTRYVTMAMIEQTMQPRPTEAVQQAMRSRGWKLTMADMRSLAVSLEARATDVNEYPETMSMTALQPLISPVYIRNVPMRDAWGNEFKYIGSPDKAHYRIVSAGADGVFEPHSLRIEWTPAEPIETDRPEDDIIFSDGAFVQAPREAVREHQRR